MTREEAHAENLRDQLVHLAACAELEREAARYRLNTALAITLVQAAIDQINAPFLALAAELRRVP